MIPETPPERWTALAGLFGIHAVAAFGLFGIAPLLPAMRDDLGLSYAEAGAVSSACFIGVLATSIVAGWMADRLGIGRMLFWGPMLWGTCLMVAPWMPAILAMALVMALAGVGYSVVTPATNKATLLWFHDRLRATAIGFKQTGINMGGFAAAFVLPALALLLNWTYALSAAGLLTVAGTSALRLFWRAHDGERALRTPGGTCWARSSA